MHGDTWKNQLTEDSILDAAVDDERKNAEVWFPLLMDLMDAMRCS